MTLTSPLMPILLIEDNPDDANLTKRALQKANVQNPIIHLRDGEEALAHLGLNGDPAKMQEKPIVILLDLKLPKINGLEVLQKIRSTPHTKPLPVVVMTTSDEQEDLVRSYELGVNSYVRKPIAFQDFSDVVANIGIYWAMINTPPNL